MVRREFHQVAGDRFTCEFDRQVMDAEAQLCNEFIGEYVEDRVAMAASRQCITFIARKAQKTSLRQ